ncbi:MAG: hypothetical protein GX575_29435 [Candidatus Anammoximicrobium sp.]|nr:hypothetical protein [Candidatus Anammoximicrobium sp.]
MSFGEDWLTRNSAEADGKALLKELSTRAEADRAIGEFDVSHGHVAHAVQMSRRAGVGVLREGFFSSVGIVNEVDGTRETWYLTQALVGAKFADLNVIPWTNWIGDVYTRARNAIREGSVPSELEYGPPAKKAVRPLGPIVEYLIRERQLRRCDFFSTETPAADLLEFAEVADVVAEEPDYGLKSIVRTLDLAQNDQIRGPLQGVFILTGGPGVGKTTVALHRVPYLIDAHADPQFPVPKDARPVTAESTLVVVWKKHLVPYLMRCLEQLGLVSFPQENVTLVDDWVSRNLRSYIPFGQGTYTILYENERVERAKLLFSEADISSFLETSSDLSTSFASEFTSVFEGIIATYNSLAKETGLLRALAERGHETVSYRESVQEAGRMARNLEDAKANAPVSEIRLNRLNANTVRMFPLAAYLTAFLHEFYASSIAQRKLAAKLSAADLQRFNETVARQVVNRAISPADRYFLLWSIELLRGAGVAPVKPEPLTRYSHVMIDEAQYYEPIVLRLLSRLAQIPTGTMTIVGDLEQRITHRGGLISWESARLSVPQENVNRLEVNYRWSENVFEFLELFRRAASIAEPLTRPRKWFSGHGLRPEVRTFESEEEEWGVVAERLCQLRSDKLSSTWTTVVVVPDGYRSSAERTFIPNLNAYAVPARWATGEDVKESVHQVVVTDFDSIVGLEFNAVFVLGLHQVLFRHERDAIQAVWVALTRARQFLFVSRINGDSIFDRLEFAEYRGEH